MIDEAYGKVRRGILDNLLLFSFIKECANCVKIESTSKSPYCDWRNSEDDVVSNTLLIAALIVIYGDEVRFRCSRLSQSNEDLATN
jgi:hypothetical protein